jgi:hypothetical protein
MIVSPETLLPDGSQDLFSVRKTGEISAFIDFCPLDKNFTRCRCHPFDSVPDDLSRIGEIPTCANSSIRKNLTFLSI